jgi:hypothetical protein
MIADRIEAEVGEDGQLNPFEPQQEEDERPLPDGPMMVGIDGGYVRAAHKQGCFEVIAVIASSTMRRRLVLFPVTFDFLLPLIIYTRIGQLS